MSQRIRVGLIGAGRIGQRHARTLGNETPNAELAVVCDVAPELAQQTAASAQAGRWTDDPATVVADPSIDAVVIASSTASHAPLIMAAAANGKDIFCEKPIALDLETTDAALAAVAAAGVRLQIGFQRRFDAGFRRAKEMIDAGEIGTVESIRDTMRDPQPASRAYIETCGGLFRDMTIHNFDNVRWLMGDEVVSVFAVAANLVDPVFAEFEDVDTSIVTLTFRHGGMAVIDNSRRSGFGYDVRTDVFGSTGALFVGYSRDTPLLHLSAAGVVSDHVQWFLERFDSAYVDEIKAFVNCIEAGAAPEVDGADGRMALALAYAAEASRREGKPTAVARFIPEAVG